MGLSDFIERVKSGEIFDLFGEIKEITRETKEELGELFTDGLREMVLNGNSQYRTSMEIKSDAGSLLGSIRSRYEESLENLKSEISAAEAAVSLFEEKSNETVNGSLYEWFKIIEETDQDSLRKLVGELKAEYSGLSFDFTAGKIAASSIGDSARYIIKPPSYRQPSPTWVRRPYDDIVVRSLMPRPVEFRCEVSRRDRVNAARDYEAAVIAYGTEVDNEILLHMKNMGRIQCLYNNIAERYEILKGFSDNMKTVSEMFRSGRISSGSEIIIIATMIMSVIITAGSLPLLEENPADSLSEKLKKDILKINKHIAGSRQFSASI